MASEVLTNTGNDLREELVSTAVKFLSNPNVQRCTLESKERFLRNKGLSDIEIQKAIEKCADMINVPAMTSELMFFRHSRRSWFRENVLPLIVYGGFAYGLYWFYKNCLRNLIFVEEPKRKSTAELLEEIRKAIDILNSNMSSLRSEVQSVHQTNETAALRSQIDAVKCDLASVKGILLSRSQFPQPQGRASPPHIPAWQRQSEPTAEAPTGKSRRPQRSASGGSNSSEGEHAAKNSDSSLEIIT